MMNHVEAERDSTTYYRSIVQRSTFGVAATPARWAVPGAPEAPTLDDARGVSRILENTRGRLGRLLGRSGLPTACSRFWTVASEGKQE